MLAIRLSKVLPTIINSDQTYVPGKNIALNTRTLNDVIKYANSKNIKAAILFIYQEKAFDRVDHSFLIKTLEHLNFGNSFVTWIKILMKNITSQVKINGVLTKPFSMTRGIKQGYPLRVLLYVIIAEILGNQIRSNGRIKGVRVGNSEKKIMQYADDTELFVTDDESINQIFFELKCYETATGAKVNVDKTEGLWPGSWKGRQDRPYNCKWTSDKVKVLGIWLGNQDTSGGIFNELHTKIKLKLAFWKDRNLLLIGRVRVINIYNILLQGSLNIAPV